MRKSAPSVASNQTTALTRFRRGSWRPRTRRTQPALSPPDSLEPISAIMIGFGATLVQRYEWVLLVFAAFLIFTGIRMLMSGHEDDADPSESWMLSWLTRHMRVTNGFVGNRFFVRQPGPSGKALLYATPLFVALVAIEFADLIFAVDSVPAIFAITTDPYLVYTSNIFAILGLRALFFALAAIIHRFEYLKQALAILLIFIGSKVFLADLMGLEKFPPAVSLGITFAILGAGVAWSLWRTRGDSPPPPSGA